MNILIIFFSWIISLLRADSFVVNLQLQGPLTLFLLFIKFKWSFYILTLHGSMTDSVSAIKWWALRKAEGGKKRRRCIDVTDEVLGLSAGWLQRLLLPSTDDLLVRGVTFRRSAWIPPGAAEERTCNTSDKAWHGLSIEYLCELIPAWPQRLNRDGPTLRDECNQSQTPLTID